MTTETRTAHTPGPWEVTEAIYVRAGSGAINPDTGETWDRCLIAQATDKNWKWSDKDTLEANARLIAAAPDLLAALTRVMQWLEGQDDVMDVLARYGEWNDITDEVGTLEAKARGDA